MMEKIKDYFDVIGKNYKKEIIKILLIELILLIAGVGLSFLYKNIIYIIVSLVLLLITPVIMYFLYESSKKAKESRLFNDFINSLIYFRIYLEAGFNIYQAFNEILKYSSNELLSEKIKIMLSQIDNDKSVVPYLNFAKNFNREIIDQLMLSIYEMNDSLSDTKHINSFIYLFDKILENSQKEQEERKKQNLLSKANYSLVGGAIFILAIIVGVINLMGSVISGF